jgi:probable rRNA maturation factor
MRRVNRAVTGRARLTDVIAYAYPMPDGTLLGDIYLCPDAAARWSGGDPRAQREELLRLAVHGTLHVLGYDHPAGAGRTRSAMWRRQERYVRRLAARAG